MNFHFNCYISIKWVISKSSYLRNILHAIRLIFAFYLQLSLLGYRDAEVAFLEVSDSETPYTGYCNKPNNSVRKTLCLLIHAPHLHSLELWCLIHGPRIVSWDVVEPVRLIQTERQNHINTTKSNEFK